MIKNLSDPQSKVYKVVNTTLELLVLNFLFLLTCIPIVTIGSGALALARMTMKQVNNQLTHPVVTFFKELKHNFLKGFIIHVWLSLLCILLFTAIRLLPLLPTIQFYFIGIGCMIACIGFIVLIDGIFHYTARYEDTIFNSFLVILKVAGLKWKDTLITVLSWSTAIFFIWIDFFWFRLFSFTLFIIGFALVSYISTKRTIKKFKEYEEV